MPRSLLAGLFLLSVVSRPVQAECTTPFESPDYYPTGVNNQSLALAYVNSDALPDVVVSGDSVEETLSWLPALPSGGFGAPVRIPFNTRIDTPVWGDFDADGDDDLVAIRDDYYTGTQSLRYSRNDGGSFASPTTRPLPNVGSPVIGDFNGDGRKDLVIFGNHIAIVLHGDGNGSFTEQHFPTGSSRFVAAGSVVDFDGDGFDDIAATTSERSYLLFFGAASGLFREVREIPNVGTVGWPLILDYDGDGKLDGAALFGSGGNRLRIVRDLLGQAEITFVELYPNFEFAYSKIAAGDLDGDGGPEVVALTRSGGILLDGRHYLSLGPNLESGLLLTDVNRDGRPDVVTANRANIVVLKNRGDGTFRTGTDVGYVLGAADLNGDGRMDILSSKVRLQRPDGSFAEGAEIPFVNGMPIDPRFGDINGDGHLDFVFLVKGSMSDVGRTVGINRGDGTFLMRQSALQGVSLESDSKLADIDGDGYLDLLAVLRIHGGNTSHSIARGRSDGDFGPWEAMPTPTAAGLAADLDADGDVDLIDGASVWMNDGAGRFTARPLAGEVVPRAVGDFNGDRIPDFVGILGILNENHGYDLRLVIALGRGDGDFDSSGWIAIPRAGRFHLGDFNGDRRTDVLLSSLEHTSDEQTSFVAFGDGRGGFDSLASFLKWDDMATIRQFSVVDWNRDGFDDIVDGRFVRLSTCFQPQPKRRAVRR